MSSQLTLDELSAFNAELAALVRAGIPLDSGLAGVSGQLTGRLRNLTAELAEAMARGESLEHALTVVHNRALPPLYVAVVRAGLRSGRLPMALESIAVTARRLGELRSAAGMAVIYPVIVLLLAYALFLFLVLEIAPHTAAAYSSFGVPQAAWMTEMQTWAGAVTWWGPVFPCLLLLAVAIWWRRSARLLALRPSLAARWTGWIPGSRGVLISSQAAAFAEVLAVLLEQLVPLDEAVVLAAEASGSADFARQAEAMSTAIRQGQPLSQAAARATRVPPLLRWLMASGQSADRLAEALRGFAEHYRQRALRQAELCRMLLPVVLTIGIGGSATAAYAVVMYLPWITLLHKIAEPS